MKDYFNLVARERASFKACWYITRGELVQLSCIISIIYFYAENSSQRQFIYSCDLWLCWGSSQFFKDQSFLHSKEFGNHWPWQPSLKCSSVSVVPFFSDFK